MTGQSQLIWGVFVGAIALAVIELAVDDWRKEAQAHEEKHCNDQDRPDTKAYMARLPNESHTVEFCLHAIRFGSKDWVPEMGAVLPPDKMKIPSQ